ncbi:MAG: hypothetical protein EOM66_11030 [Clostridia bacterium]|nr:hypothetical protein [Clostridia bacterium]
MRRNPRETAHEVLQCALEGPDERLFLNRARPIHDSYARYTAKDEHYAEAVAQHMLDAYVELFGTPLAEESDLRFVAYNFATLMVVMPPNDNATGGPETGLGGT